MRKSIAGIVGSVIICLAVTILTAGVGVVRADSVAFDFNSGPGPNFAVVNDGGLWTVDTGGPDLRIAKAADDGAFLPTSWIHAGIRSGFVLNGNFTVTVYFALPDFPGAQGTDKVNESMLLVSPRSGVGFTTLRLVLNNQQLIEGYSEPPSSPLTVADTTITSGRYRISRTGSTLTGMYAPEGSSTFNSLGSFTDSAFSEPMHIELLANQGMNAGLRSTTAMDIRFDNLIIEADSLTGLVPEPSTFVLLGMGSIALLGFAWRRKRAVRCLMLGVAVLPVLAAGAAQAVTIETVLVGNPGNLPDTRYNGVSVGAVGREYRIGTYEVTTGQYATFLNAVAATTDTYGLYNPSMWTSPEGCKIKQTPVSGGYTYTVAVDYADRPVNYVSFWDATRFTNWLHNGQPSGVQGLGTTERGAYTLDGYNGTDGGTIARNSDAQWWIPSDDEWYKAAYHKGDGPTANYWDYPTKRDSISPPGRDTTELTNPGNNVNCWFEVDFTPYPIDGTHFTTVKGEFELSDSAYHTFDQGGNVHEWNDTVVNQTPYAASRGWRGGSYSDNGSSLLASHLSSYEPPSEFAGLGFRVASVPEPSTFVLLGLGAIGLLAFAWRRRQPAQPR